MTVCFPPLIKPDSRFSRIRLSEFLSLRAKAPTPVWICNDRTLLALVAEMGRHQSSVTPPLCRTSGVPSLLYEFSKPKVWHGITTTTNASDFCHGPISLVRCRRTCAAVGIWPPQQISPFIRASLSSISPMQTPPVYCRNPQRLVWVLTLRPSPNLEGLGCREWNFEAHFYGSCELRASAGSSRRTVA
jgi:hypothetical protein